MAVSKLVHTFASPPSAERAPRRASDGFVRGRSGVAARGRIRAPCAGRSLGVPGVFRPSQDAGVGALARSASLGGLGAGPVVAAMAVILEQRTARPFRTPSAEVAESYLSHS